MANDIPKQHMGSVLTSHQNKRMILFVLITHEQVKVIREQNESHTWILIWTVFITLIIEQKMVPNNCKQQTIVIKHQQKINLTITTEHIVFRLVGQITQYP